MSHLGLAKASVEVFDTMVWPQPSVEIGRV